MLYFFSCKNFGDYKDRKIAIFYSLRFHRTFVQSFGKTFAIGAFVRLFMDKGLQYETLSKVERNAMARGGVKFPVALFAHLPETKF